LDVTAEGKWKAREARLYRLTFISSGAHGQVQATNEYAAWTPREAKSRLPLRGTEKPRTVPLTGTEANPAVPLRGTSDPISSVWGKAEPVPLRGTLIGKPCVGAELEGHSTPSYADDPNRAPSCERCHEPFTSAGRGQPKRFCSERCRKAAEAQRRHDRQRAAA
jgi:hypothetical protein